MGVKTYSIIGSTISLRGVAASCDHVNLKDFDETLKRNQRQNQIYITLNRDDEVKKISFRAKGDKNVRRRRKTEKVNFFLFALSQMSCKIHSK